MNSKLAKQLRKVARHSTIGKPSNIPAMPGRVRVVVGTPTTRGLYLQLKKQTKRGMIPRPDMTHLYR